MAGGSVSIFDLNLGLGASVGKVKADTFSTKLFRFKVVESKTTLCKQILDSLDLVLDAKLEFLFLAVQLVSTWENSSKIF